jgi:hypothetical protein
VKYWQIIANDLSKAAFSWGCSTDTDSIGRTIFLFDGVPGDTIPGDNNYSLPVETVETGAITID